MNLRHAAPLLLFPLLLGALVAGGSALQRTTSVRSGLAQPALASEGTTTDEQSATEFEAWRHELRRRMQLKDLLVTELVAGRATLADVNAQFLALNRARDGHMHMIRQHFPGETDTEKSARNVISYVSLDLGPVGPIHRLMILARLEIELQEIVAHESSTNNLSQ